MNLAEALWGRGELWPRFPTPLIGQLEKVFTYRKFGSFLHPKHKSSPNSQAPLCWQRRGEGLPWGLG